MLHDPTAGLYFDKPYLDEYLDTAFAVVDFAEPDVAVGSEHLRCRSRLVIYPAGWTCLILAGTV